MLSIDTFMVFMFGTMVGVLVALAIQHMSAKSDARAIGKEIRKIEEEKERRDPANWWKYGGNPFDSNYDQDDDDDHRRLA